MYVYTHIYTYVLFAIYISNSFLYYFCIFLHSLILSFLLRQISFVRSHSLVLYFLFIRSHTHTHTHSYTYIIGFVNKLGGLDQELKPGSSVFQVNH